MFNWLQHLFTARALQRENAELVKQVSSLQAKVDEQTEVIAVKDKEIWCLKDKAEEPQEPLDPMAVKILTLLASSGGSTRERIATALQANVEFVAFHLEKLLAIECVNRPAPYTTSETWSIAQEGRAYLVSHDLL